MFLYKLFNYYDVLLHFSYTLVSFVRVDFVPKVVKIDLQIIIYTIVTSEAQTTLYLKAVDTIGNYLK